ncbi:MAG: glycerophosphodiester phosphodiesterase [Deltaproteobacteria bacterium]|nr:glycerophosphodiester phosphodiesterase [Deltaproteobacteria bacterium]
MTDSSPRMLDLARAAQRSVARMPGPPPASFYGAQRPLVLAHRGARTRHAENTVGAFVLGMELGADGVELDVHLSKDRRVVVFHDTHLDRAGRAGVALASLTWDELRELDLRHLVKDGPAEEAAVHMPLLEEVFEALPPTARVNVELKGGASLAPDGLEVEALRVVARCHAEDRVVYSSFSPARCLRLRSLAPDAWVGMLHEPGQSAALRHLHLLPAVAPHALHPHFSMVDDAYLAHARALRTAVHVWTVNEPAEVRRLRALDVDAIITDVPDVALRELGRGTP